MLTPREVLQISSQFDAQLITLGEWSVDDKRILNRWLEQPDAETKGRTAAEVIAFFASQYLKNDISMEGRIRIKKLRNVASLLERLVFTTRELDEKFYRDHISHMLKVALLAKAIARKKPFCLPESRLDTLVLACVFHDIAYPLSECGRIFNKTLDSLKDCYSTAELFVNELIRESRVDIGELACLTGESEERLRIAFREMNHGLLSAIELKAALKNEKSVGKFSDAIRAIALHDSDFNTPIDVINDPIAGLLVISDELQDWGRPTDQGVTIIPRIDDFEVSDGHLSGVFNVKNNSNFSILKQISSKMSNLRKLSVNSNKLEFSFRFNLRDFEKIDHGMFRKLLHILFNSVDKKLMNPSNNIDLTDTQYFERAFFGLEITAPVKENLYRDLLGLSKSRKKDFNIYLNNHLSEMIIAKEDFGDIEAITLSNEKSNKISAKITGKKEVVSGDIYSSSSSETMEVLRMIAAEIRFINYMIHEIGGPKVEPILGFPKLEGLAEPSMLEKVAEKLGNNFSEIYDVTKIGSVVESLKNRACFLFE